MRYVALLRGINISGKNKISMSDLKRAIETNYQNVVTYLNSGNIIFDSNLKDKEFIISSIEGLIKDSFNLDIPVFIMTSNELEDILSNSPKWWNTNNKDIYDNLIFLIYPTKYEEVYKAIGSTNANIEKVKEYNNSIFWSFDLNNYRKSNWWVKTASTDIKDKITIRTANTMKKVLEICIK